MDIVKGGKEKKENAKQARERRDKVGFVPRNKDVLIDIIDIKPRALDSGIIMTQQQDLEAWGLMHTGNISFRDMWLTLARMLQRI